MKICLLYFVLISFNSINVEKIEKIQNYDIINTNTFNVFEFAKQNGKENILSIVTKYTLNKLIENKESVYKEKNLESFLKEISDHYNDLSLTNFRDEDKRQMEIDRKEYENMNPYHNIYHATDVVQKVFLYLTQSDICTILKCDKYDKFSLIISAAIHDFGHPGKNNLFMNKYDMLFDIIKEEKQSYLESFHYEKAMEIIEKHHLLWELSSDRLVLEKVISLIKESVLGTDMQKHYNHINLLDVFAKAKNINLDSVANFYKNKNQLLASVVHAADISNPAFQFEMCLRLSILINRENCFQKKYEEKYKIDTFAKCPENDEQLYEGIISFINEWIVPFFKTFTNAFSNLDYLNVNIQKNLEECRKRITKNENL